MGVGVVCRCRGKTIFTCTLLKCSCRENIHHILYRLVFTSYIYSLVIWLPCQQTNGMLVGPLPWKKSGRKTWQRVSRRNRTEEEVRSLVVGEGKGARGKGGRRMGHS